MNSLDTELDLCLWYETVPQPSLPFHWMTSIHLSLLVRPTYVTKCAMPVLLPFVISPLGAPSQVSDQARMLTSLPFFKYLIMECTVQLSIYYISHGDQQEWELLPFRCRPDTCCQFCSASRHTYFLLNWSEQQSNKWTARIVKKISTLFHNCSGRSG